MRLHVCFQAAYLQTLPGTGSAPRPKKKGEKMRKWEGGVGEREEDGGGGKG